MSLLSSAVGASPSNPALRILLRAFDLAHESTGLMQARLLLSSAVLASLSNPALRSCSGRSILRMSPLDSCKRKLSPHCASSPKQFPGRNASSSRGKSRTKTRKQRKPGDWPRLCEIILGFGRDGQPFGAMCYADTNRVGFSARAAAQPVRRRSSRRRPCAGRVRGSG